MSAYVPNFAKTPLEIMLGLINFDNNKGYAPSDVALRNLTALDPQVDPTGKNASVEVDLLNAPSEVEGDWVKFWFDRVDLEGLFAGVITASKNNVREVEVVVDGQLDTDLFISEVLRKYGVALNTTDFDIVLTTASRIDVTAKASNYAYTGTIAFGIDAALITRVSVTAIEGFTAANVDLDPSDDA